MSDGSDKPSDSDRIAELESAFELFTRTSRQLSRSYEELEQRVADLNQELASAREARMRELAEKERLGNRLEQLLEALPGGVVVIDRGGRVTESNPAAESLLGRPLNGEPWEAVRRRAFRGEISRAGEVNLRTGRRVSLSQRDLRGEEGRIMLLTDVSETRALQELVDRHQRLSAMGEMAARLAHQIRTPLSAALLYSSQLEEALGEGPGARLAPKLAGRLRRIEAMVSDMLMFARGGSRDAERLRLEEVFAEAAGQVKARWRDQVGLEVRGGRGLTLQGSREALLGALSNLLDNAAEATGEGGCIRLVGEDDGRDRVLIRVRDDGPGIPQDIRDRIFEPFYTTRPQGTGLGLAVVRSVVEAHGGNLALVSPEEGGAEFLLAFPAADTGSGGRREANQEEQQA